MKVTTAKKMQKNPQAQVISFGCKINHAEAGQIRALLRQAKLTKKTTVINSCCVTNEAERQLRQKIRQIHRQTPETQIIVTGCAAQTNSLVYKNMDAVAKVIGNDRKLFAKSYTEKNISEIKDDATTRLLALDGRHNIQTRFVLPVQQGCDHRCTFCIIPFARGKSRSLNINQACRSVQQAVDSGVREVVLSGIDIASWGADLEGQPVLGQLVEAILRKVTCLDRLRLSSIDGAALDENLKELIASEKKLMPHIHLSLQAGDNMILKRMRRRHSREQAIKLCNELREKRKDIALGADLIAGFPTETKEMFENTLAMVDEASLNFLHIFPFSPMRYTPAAKMPQVERATIRQRANQLRKKADITQTKFLLKQHNTIDSFLIETITDDNNAIAKSRHNIRTRLLATPNNKSSMKKGALITAQILPSEMQRDGRSLLAKVIPNR